MNSPSEAGSDIEEFPGAQAWDMDGDGFSDAEPELEGTEFDFARATEEDVNTMDEEHKDEASAAENTAARRHLRHQNFSHIGGMSFEDWRRKGRAHWEQVKASITPENANAVRCMAMSHWNTLEDFAWLERQHLPKLRELDLSDISDFYLSEHDGYTWEQLRDTIPTVLKNVEIVWVRNWTSAQQHARVRVRYANYEPLFSRDRTNRLRMPDSRGGQGSRSDITLMLTACTRLRYLKIVGKWKRSQYWRVEDTYLNERGEPLESDSSHERVCELVRGINTCVRGTPLRHIHLYQSYFSPLLLEALGQVEKNIHLRVSLNGFFACHHPWRFQVPQDEHHARYTTAEDQCIGPVLGLLPWYTAKGNDCTKELATRHLEWHKEDTNFYTNHLSISTFLVRLFSSEQSNVNLSLSRLHDQAHPISFFNFIDLNSDYMGLFGRNGNKGESLPDGTTYQWPQKKAMQTINWLRRKMNWQPAFSIDPFISPHFPENLLPAETLDAERKASRTADKVRRIATHKLMKKRVLKVLLTLSATQIEKNRHPYPIHLWIGDRPPQEPAALWGALSRQDWQGWQKPQDSEAWKPTDIAMSQYFGPLIEVLTIEYPDWMPHLASGPNASARLNTPKLLTREAEGWQRFWYHYALRFRHLWRLNVAMPQNFDEVYSWRLARLLYGKKWVGPEIHPDEKGRWTVFVKRSWERRTRGEMKFSAKDWEESEETFVDDGDEDDDEDDDGEEDEEEEEGVLDTSGKTVDAVEEVQPTSLSRRRVSLFGQAEREMVLELETKDAEEPGSQNINQGTESFDDLFEEQDEEDFNDASDPSPAQVISEENSSAKHSNILASTESPISPIPPTRSSTHEVSTVSPSTDPAVAPVTPVESVPANFDPITSPSTPPAPTVPEPAEENIARAVPTATFPPSQPPSRIVSTVTEPDEEISEMPPISPTKSRHKSAKPAPTPAPAPHHKPTTETIITSLPPTAPDNKSRDEVLGQPVHPDPKPEEAREPKSPTKSPRKTAKPPTASAPEPQSSGTSGMPSLATNLAPDPLPAIAGARVLEPPRTEPAPARNPMIEHLVEGLRLPEDKTWGNLFGPEQPTRRNLRSSGPAEQVLASPTKEERGEEKGMGRKRKRMTEKERLRITMEGWAGEKRRKG